MSNLDIKLELNINGAKIIPNLAQTSQIAEAISQIVLGKVLEPTAKLGKVSRINNVKRAYHRTKPYPTPIQQPNHYAWDLRQRRLAEELLIQGYSYAQINRELNREFGLNRTTHACKSTLVLIKRRLKKEGKLLPKNYVSENNVTPEQDQVKVKSANVEPDFSEFIV